MKLYGGVLLTVGLTSNFWMETIFTAENANEWAKYGLWKTLWIALIYIYIYIYCDVLGRMPSLLGNGTSMDTLDSPHGYMATENGRPLLGQLDVIYGGCNTKFVPVPEGDQFL
jgi:hypothetical protein